MKTIRKLTDKKLETLKARVLGKMYLGRGAARMAKVFLRIADETSKRALKEMP